MTPAALLQQRAGEFAVRTPSGAAVRLVTPAGDELGRGSRDRRRKRRRGRDQSSDSDSGSGDAASGSAFHRALQGGGESNSIQATAQRCPGMLLAGGLAQMRRFADPAAHALEGGSQEPMAAIATKYVTMILHTLKKGNLHPETERELRTIGTSLDLLVQGNLAGIGDLLMQRLKSVEARAFQGQNFLGKHLELLPSVEVSALSQSERAVATNLEAKELKLRELLSKQKKQNS